MPESVYSVDTSIFIENWRRLYPPDVFPAVWSFMAEKVEQGIALISVEVLDELQKKDDDLLAWLKEREEFLIPTDGMIQSRTREINDQFPDLVDIERERSVADPFVIAVAGIHNGAVVTYEKPRTNQRKPPKIPDVCQVLGLTCINFIEFARHEGLTL